MPPGGYYRLAEHFVLLGVGSNKIDLVIPKSNLYHVIKFSKSAFYRHDSKISMLEANICQLEKAKH